MASLFVINGPMGGRSFELEKEAILIGRSPANDIQIKDRSISRQHAKIQKIEDRYFIEDLNSQNGTLIIGDELKPGDPREIDEGVPVSLGNIFVSLNQEFSEGGMVSRYCYNLSKQFQEGKKDFLVLDRRLTSWRNLALIHEVSTFLMQSLDTREIGEKIMDSLFTGVRRVDSGTILLFDQRTGELEPFIARTRNSVSTEVKYSRTIVSRVIREGKAILMADTSQEDEKDLSESIEAMRIKSIMCVPLISMRKTLGVIYLHAVNVAKGFQKDDLFLLTGLSAPAALAVENALHYEERRRSEKALQEARDELQSQIGAWATTFAEGEKQLRHEVRQREKAEKAFVKSQECHQALTENIPDGYFICEIPSGKILHMNKKGLSLLGYTRQPDAAFSIWDMFASNEHGRLKKRIANHLENRPLSSERQIYQALGKDGTVFQAEISASFVTYQGKNAIQAVFRNVSEQEILRKQLQHAQKIESIGVITTGVAHNFRNILTGISVNSELIQARYFDNDHLVEISNRIMGAVKRGTQLVDGLTQFSHKQQEFNYQPLDLMEIIRDIHQLISTSFDKRIDITMEGHDNLLIQGDRSDLSHVLMNLCTNAHDAMPDGGKLTIKAWQEKDAAIIEVSDTGLGMDPETVEKCLDSFYTNKEFDKGTGLGLSTAYGIVKDHGGDIWVHSEPGAGTTFMLTFPSVEPIEEPLPDPSMELVPGKGQKILFVDDEMEMLVPLVDLLEGLGYRVTSVNNAKDAISVFKSWHPDLVLLDRNMPIMDGIDCAKNILRYDTDAVIVLISGYEEDGPNGIDEPTRAMIKAYLTKPIKIAELSQTLAKVLE